MKEDFKWTDELVQQFAKEYRASSSRVSIDMFKKYQNPKEYNKDWEILSYKVGDIVYEKYAAGIFVKQHPEVYETEEHLLSKNAMINSIRRLSDGEVFSIGDEVGYDNGNIRTMQDWKIDNFYIRESDGVLVARGKDFANVEIVDKWLYKSKPKEKPPQLYTQQKVDELCEKAFGAAREWSGGFSESGTRKYISYQDYKNSKQ